MPLYQKKPVVIEARQYTGEADNEASIIAWCGGTVTGKKCTANGTVGLFIRTLEGDMMVDKGSYVIKGVKGEFYPCRKDIFEETYDVFRVEQVNA